MSRSCHRATSSRAVIACPRSTRAMPQTRSHSTGLRLCGIAEDPFWCTANGSSASPTSVCWSSRSAVASRSSTAPRTAAAQTNAA